MAYYDRIKEARKAKKLTQRQISEMVGVATTTFNGYENGNREPSMYTLSKIMETLDVDANYLFQDEMNTKKEPDTQSVSSPDLQKIKETLVQFLTLAGYIKPGEDITDEQLRFLEGVVLLLDHYFDQQS